MRRNSYPMTPARAAAFAINNFSDLLDAFSYVGKANYLVYVRADETGLEARNSEPLLITDTFVVGSEAAMLALTAQRGDVAVRTDISKTFILQATPASTLVNWVEVLFSDAVLSVNGKTGTVVLTYTDVGAAAASHASQHNAGGGDALAIDSAAATGSLRTLGTAATAACAGNDSRLSDARTPTAHASTHNAGGGDALAIDAAAATGSLRTLGTAATAACAGNDSRLSDARTPTGTAGGDLSGSYANPTVKASTVAFAFNAAITPSTIGGDQNDYNPTGLSGANTLRLATSAAYALTGLAGGAAGRLVMIQNIGSFNLTLSPEAGGSTAANRFSLSQITVVYPNAGIILQYDGTASRWRVVGKSVDFPNTAKATAISTDKIWIQDGATNTPKYTTVAGLVESTRQVFIPADALSNPQNANWALNVLAPLTLDPTNAAIMVRAMDDDQEEGVGVSNFYVPAGVTNLIMELTGRPYDAQNGTTIKMGVYARDTGNGGAVGSWSTFKAFGDFTMQNDAYFRTYSKTYTLAELGLTADRMASLEITRQGNNDSYGADWYLAGVKIFFS